MDFSLALGEDMHLIGDDSIVLRQGTHLMDAIVISLGEKYVGALGHLEYRLSGDNTYATRAEKLDEILRVDVPLAVTRESGNFGMQLVIEDGNRILRSDMRYFSVTPSVCAKLTTRDIRMSYDVDITNDTLYNALPFDDGVYSGIIFAVEDMSGESLLTSFLSRVDTRGNIKTSYAPLIESGIDANIDDNGSLILTSQSGGKSFRGKMLVSFA